LADLSLAKASAWTTASTIIKIGKNGVINIISANFENAEKMKKDLAFFKI
jgi:hypothetical protein